MKAWIDGRGKSMARTLSPLVRVLRARGALAHLGDYAAFLEGRGSGSGWDPDGEARAVSKQIKRPDAVIFDVGANDGRWSLALARQLGSENGQFYLFECSPYVLPRLRERLGKIPRATLVEAAVSHESGTVQLHTPTRGSGLASLHERRDVGIQQEHYESISVRSVTIDSVVEERGIERIDLLKMDIEGHELHALKGAARILGRRGVAAIEFEFGSANVNSRTFFRDYYDLLTEAGFAISRIAPRGTLFPVQAYHERLEYFRGATNYLAVLQ